MNNGVTGSLVFLFIWLGRHKHINAYKIIISPRINVKSFRCISICINTALARLNDSYDRFHIYHSKESVSEIEKVFLSSIRKIFKPFVLNCELNTANAQSLAFWKVLQVGIDNDYVGFENGSSSNYKIES